MGRAASLPRLLFLAAALGLLLAAALAWPRARRAPPDRRALALALVDASADVARASEWLSWTRSELRRVALGTQAAGEDLAVLSYADGVVVGFAPGAPEVFLALLEGRAGTPFDPGAGLEHGATRLADALLAAEPLLGDVERAGARLVLLAPPSYTDASPAGVLARLRESGIGIETRAPPRPRAADLGVLALELPARVEVGAPLVARARLLWRGGAAGSESATLLLERESGVDGGGVQREARALALPDHEGEFELPLDFGPAAAGRNVLRARAELASGPDLLRENDLAQASALGGDARAVGIVVRDELRAAAEAWLAPAARAGWAGLDFVFLRPAELGPALPGLAALVTVDLAPAELPGPLVASFVRAGGGWLATGGWRFLARWPDPANELAALLPCEPAGAELAPREVVLLVDGSGSMEGAAFDGVRAAALELVAAALPGDRVSLRFFTRGLEEAHVLKERSSGAAAQEDARRAARELLALRVPNGTTYLLRSLRELPAASEGVETLALLLSDGREREAYPDAPAEAAALRSELAAERTRLAVIALGEPDLALLAALAGGADAVRFARTPGELATVLQRELSGARLFEGELELRRAASVPDSLADEILGRAGESGPGRVRRYVRARLRPLAEALLLGAEDEPVLAVGRAELGRSALFASSPAGDWSEALSGPARWSGLLRWLARGPEDAPPRARLAGRKLVLSGLAGDPAPALAARVLDLEGLAPPAELELFPPAELGADARHARVGELAQRPPRASAVCFETSSGELCLPLEVALPDEFAGRERAVPAAWLGGTTPRAAVPALRPAAHRSAVWVLAAALVLLFAAGLVAGRGQGVGPSSR